MVGGRQLTVREVAKNKHGQFEASLASAAALTSAFTVLDPFCREPSENPVPLSLQ
jgi:hypothetical protein